MDANRFEGIRISIASPEKIRSWSYGEVKKPEENDKVNTTLVTEEELETEEEFEEDFDDMEGDEE